MKVKKEAFFSDITGYFGMKYRCEKCNSSVDCESNYCQNCGGKLEFDEEDNDGKKNK